MRIPDYPKLREYPKFVKDKVDATYCTSLKELIDVSNSADKLNQDTTFTVEFEVALEGVPWSGEEASASFYYKRKPNKEELLFVDSDNYRTVQDYINFIEKNPKVAKALKMKNYV
jgi:hypothetical protein